MTYEPYSIVVLPFPFTDCSTTKKRPALLLSSTDHQIQTEHATVLMITSAKNSSWKSDHSIENLETTGLKAASTIRQKIFTIDSRLIIKSVGKLAEIDKKEIVKKLKQHLILN